MGLVHRMDSVRFHTVFSYGSLFSESKVFTIANWICPVFLKVTRDELTSGVAELDFDFSRTNRSGDH